MALESTTGEAEIGWLKPPKPCRYFTAEALAGAS
jgi:hypothetical protein